MRRPLMMHSTDSELVGPCMADINIRMVEIANDGTSSYRSWHIVLFERVGTFWS